MTHVLNIHPQYIKDYVKFKNKIKFKKKILTNKKYNKYEHKLELKYHKMRHTND